MSSNPSIFGWVHAVGGLQFRSAVANLFRIHECPVNWLEYPMTCTRDHITLSHWVRLYGVLALRLAVIRERRVVEGV